MSVVRSKRPPSPPLQGQAASDRALSGLQFQGVAFESSRQPDAHKIVAAANSSAQWYETFSERMRLPPLDFAFDYITRSGRIDMDRLRTLAPRFMARYEAENATGADTVTDPVAPHAPGSIEIGFDRTRHRNCSAVLWDNLDRNPDKLAVTGPAGDLTYRELCARAAKWGNAFKCAGLDRGARIAFFLDDTPAYPAAFFGAVRAGFVPVLLNIQSRSDLLNYFLEDSNATLAVCEASLASSFDAETLEGTSVERVVMVNGSDALCGRVPESAFIDGESDELACADTGSEDMAFWMYSSGSTGRPKGIVHLHHDMAYTHQSFGSHVLRLREDDRCFSVPKIFFAFGKCSDSPNPDRNDDAPPGWRCPGSVDTFGPIFCVGYAESSAAIHGNAIPEPPDCAVSKCCIKAVELPSAVARRRQLRLRRASCTILAFSSPSRSTMSSFCTSTWRRTFSTSSSPASVSTSRTRRWSSGANCRCTSPFATMRSTSLVRVGGFINTIAASSPIV